MALFYNKIQRGNPSYPKKWYLILKSIDRMTERQGAKEIANKTILNPKEAEMAIYQFQKILTKALMDGKTVQFGELGTFQLTVNSRGVDSEKDINANLAEKVNLILHILLRFVRACKKLNLSLQTVCKNEITISSCAE